MNIYVGNISRTATEQDLKDAFAAFGEVSRGLIPERGSALFHFLEDFGWGTFTLRTCPLS